MLYPYYALLASTSAATMYMMGRMVLVRLYCFFGLGLTQHISNTIHRATRLGSPATRRLPTVHYRNRAPSRQDQNTHNQSSFFPSVFPSSIIVYHVTCSLELASLLLACVKCSHLYASPCIEWSVLTSNTSLDKRRTSSFSTRPSAVLISCTVCSLSPSLRLL